MISDLISNEIIHAAKGGYNAPGLEPNSVLVLNFGKEFDLYNDVSKHLSKNDDCWMNVAHIPGPISIAQNVEILRKAAENVIPQIIAHGKPCLLVICNAYYDQIVEQTLKDYCGYIIFTKGTKDE